MNTGRPGASGPTIHYFGDYVLLGKIAEGGMGVVYDARQVSLNKRVALKLIRSGGLATEAEVRRFKTEAEAAARLDHPNIVPVFEVGQHEGQHYVAMKLVEGESLAEQLRAGIWRSERRPERERQRSIATLLAKAGRAVHHAHQRGVIHRDLKPGNILLDEAGEPHVTDFGLAKLLEGGQELTLSQAVLGTPAYMAPEQALGKSRDVTTAADIYSLGAVLYELLTGQPPFRGESRVQILEQVTSREPPAPRSVQPAIARDLEIICLKCLAKEPSRRYGSAEALAEDLERWLRGEPIQARPVSLGERLFLWARRHPVTAGLSAAVAASLVLGVAGVTWQWRRAEHQGILTFAANARLQLQRAEDLLQSGNAPLALATLARALRDNPQQRVAAERLVHVLNQHSFLVPAPIPISALVAGDPQVTHRVARSPDGALNAVVTNVQSIDLWTAGPTTSPRPLTPAHTGVVRSVCFNHTGDRLVSAAADETARIWDVRSATLLGTLPHSAPVYFAEFSPDGAVVASACRDGWVRLWDSKTGSAAGEPIQHGDALCVVRFSPDGSLLASAGDDGWVRLWSVNTRRQIVEPLKLSGSVAELHWGGDSRSLTVELVDGETRGLKPTPVAPFTSTVASPPIAAPTLEAIAMVLGMSATNYHQGEITSTNLSSDGSRLATASTDQTARIWDARTRQPLTERLMHSATVNGVCFSPDGLRLATSTADGRMRVWDAATGQPLTDWILCGQPVTGVGFSAGGRHVVASTGQAWELHTALGPAPEWLCDLAEAVAGIRINKAGLTEPSGTSVGRVKAQVLAGGWADKQAPSLKRFLSAL